MSAELNAARAYLSKANAIIAELPSLLDMGIAGVDLALERGPGQDEQYAAAARVIALHLGEFCDHSLIYPAMIEDAARKAKAEIDRLRTMSSGRADMSESATTPCEAHGEAPCEQCEINEVDRG